MSALPYAPPRTLLLGADAWQVLVRGLGGLVLPLPLRAEDGPDLDADQEAVALAALQEAGVLTGPRVPADLHPSVRASLVVQGRPTVSVDTAVQRGPERLTARHALAGPLASALRRTTVDVEGGRETGPVQLTTMLVDDLAADVAATAGSLLGQTSPAAGRSTLRLDAAAALALARALPDGRRDLAAALVGGELPDVLDDLVGRLTAVARVELASARSRHRLLAVQAGGDWWELHGSGEDVVVRPLDTDLLATQVATALTGVLVGGAA